MGVYLITYDLSKERDYDSLFEKIKEYRTYSHSLESVWIIQSSNNAKQIRENLQKVIDSDDKLFVCRLSGNWSSVRLSKKITDWLKNRKFNCECN